jgi:lysozyme
MTLRTSQNGIQIIKAFEGNRLTGYLDPVGIPTIGYGHTERAGGTITYTDGVTTSKVRVGKRIAQAEADRVKARDVDLFENALEPMLAGVAVKQHEWDALVSLMFNIGPGALAKSSVLRRLKAGDHLGAADAFLMWNKAGGRVFPGLARRRRAERALFLGNVKTAMDVAGAEPHGATSPSAVAEVRNASPIAKSRTITGGALTGFGGVALITQEARTALSDAKPNIEDGGLIGIALGAVILIGAGLALYARWDDAGRPRPSWWPL